MRIAVIGFGAAAIGFLETLKDSEHEIHVFERSKDIQSSSLSGIRSDGKLMVSKRVGGDLDVDLALQEKVLDYYLTHAQISRENVEQGESFANSTDPLFKRFYDAGFEPVQAKYYHVGTDKLGAMLGLIYEDLKKAKNLHFHFDHIVTSIETNEDKVFITHVCDSLMSSEYFDSVVLAVGRSGMKLIKNITQKYPKLLLSNNSVDLGIRFELPNHVVQDLNDKMYEFKLRLKTSTGYTVRTFCNNPSGKVVSEQYNSGDFFTVNGHAEQEHKTTNTNFAVLVTHEFTEPFNDPIAYGTYIAKLSNLLAGGNKVILQTYSDFKKSKRTKKLGRVKPTLPADQFILGDLNLVFPSRTVKAITEFMDLFNAVVPGITHPDNLLYGVEVKFYSNVCSNDYNPRIQFIGDCSGWTRSITYATAHGIMVAQKFLEEK